MSQSILKATGERASPVEKNVHVRLGGAEYQAAAAPPPAYNGGSTEASASSLSRTGADRGAPADGGRAVVGHDERHQRGPGRA